MNKQFEIRYSIFEDDLEKFRNMSLEEFESEFADIYGMFTMVFEGYEYLPYLGEEHEFPLHVRRSMSELICVHFDSLIYIADHLESSDCFYMKYIENATTWLKISVEEKDILVSKIEIERNFEMNKNLDLKFMVTSNSELFASPLDVKWQNVRIDKKIFRQEINSKLISFINEIKSVNPIILKSQIFSHQIEYLKTIVVEI